MTDRLISGAKREADAFETSIRPRSLDEFVGQEQARANLRVFIEAARGRGDALDHVLFAGPPGLGKTTLAQIMAKGAWGRIPRDLRAGDLESGRSRGAAHQSRRTRRAVHRRNPSPQSGDRGNPLSGDGGLPARPHHRRGPGGAVGAHRPGEVHARRRDDALGVADDASARPLRHSDPAQLLHCRRNWRAW